jgi:exodeoxyribonuclease VII large subunit
VKTKKIFTVSQINAYLKRIFASDYMLGHIFMKGEASNVKYHSSGHIYFSLKDESSSIACVMFAGDRREGLTFRMENGQSIVVEGRVSLYERDGTYQLYARQIELAGSGALYAEFERLKEKLYEEGLFDHERKKEIPSHPAKVGVVTAPTGAAVQDIMQIAKRRNPYVQLYLYPAKVQGEGAAASIAKGIRILDQKGLDTIIIGRGGGSMEDLWAFNEEIVARAIYEANTPIISGTGHETDTTIADYAADLRASTPSAACELAIPDISVTIERLNQYNRRFQFFMSGKIDLLKEKNAFYEKNLKYLHPENRLMDYRMTHARFAERLEKSMDERLTRYRQEFLLKAQRFADLSPISRLTGGYGYVTKEERAVLGISQIAQGDPVKIQLSDGSFDAVVTGTRKKEGEAYGEDKVSD